MYWDPIEDVRHLKLAGGPDIYACTWPNCSLEEVRIIVHAGTFHEKPGTEGTAHLLEHLLGYGGEAGGKIKSRNYFQEPGGNLNYRTNFFSTLCKFKGPAEQEFLASALNQIGRRILSFNPNQSLFEIEQGIVQGEIRESFPLRFSLELTMEENRVLFSGTPLERLILPPHGLTETVARLTIDDLNEFHQRFYTPANISIVGVGGLSTAEFFQVVKDSIFNLADGYRFSLPAPISTLPALAKNSHDLFLSEFFKDNIGKIPSRIRIATAIPGTANREAFGLANAMIEEAIDTEIRENKQWSYGSKTDWIDYSALYFSYLQFSDLPSDKLDETEDAIKRIIANLGEQAQLLEKRRMCWANCNKLADFSVNGLANHVADSLCDFQKITTFEERIETIENVTLNDIRSVLEHLGPERLWTLRQRP